MAKKEQLNTRAFMQTSAYEQAKEALQRSLNYDSINFNMNIPQYSNLIDYNKRNEVFKHTKQEIELLKEYKRKYKQQQINN